MSDDDEQEFVVGYKQLEQLGGKQREGMEGIQAAILGGAGLSDALRKAPYLRLDPLDRFKTLCEIYYNKFGGDQRFVIQWNMINSKIDTMNWPQYRNPVGFILGARIIGNDKKTIDPEKVKNLSQFNSAEMKTEGIRLEDIIRYGRLWQTLL